MQFQYLMDAKLLGERDRQQRPDQLKSLETAGPLVCKTVGRGQPQPWTIDDFCISTARAAGKGQPMKFVTASRAISIDNQIHRFLGVWNDQNTEGFATLRAFTSYVFDHGLILCVL